jgi:hypothetical protein
MLLMTASLTQADETAHRVTQGLQALYSFDQAENGLIPDKSGAGEPLNLRIDKPQNVQFRSGRMQITTPITIASDGPATKLIDAIRETGELSIEVWLTPSDLKQSGPSSYRQPFDRSLAAEFYTRPGQRSAGRPIANIVDRQQWPTINRRAGELARDKVDSCRVYSICRR